MSAAFSAFVFINSFATLATVYWCSFLASRLFPVTGSVHELTLLCQLIKNTTERVGVHWELEMRRCCHLSPEPRLFNNETSNKSLHSAFRASSPCRCADRNRARHNTRSKTNSTHKQKLLRRLDGYKPRPRNSKKTHL